MFSNNFTSSKSCFGDFLALVINAQMSTLTVTIYRPSKHNTNFVI